MMDIRVGVIQKVWNHTTADTLYCEEINVGEDAPLEICSGLRDYYSLEELQGRKVLVVCNLKAAKIVYQQWHGVGGQTRWQGGTRGTAGGCGAWQSGHPGRWQRSS
jgi:hypothetical protein